MFADRSLAYPRPFLTVARTVFVVHTCNNTMLGCSSSHFAWFRSLEAMELQLNSWKPDVWVFDV